MERTKELRNINKNLNIEFYNICMLETFSNYFLTTGKQFLIMVVIEIKNQWNIHSFVKKIVTFIQKKLSIYDIKMNAFLNIFWI